MRAAAHESALKRPAKVAPAMALAALLAGCSSGGGEGGHVAALDFGTGSQPAGSGGAPTGPTGPTGPAGPACTGHTADTCYSPSGGGFWWGQLSRAGATVNDAFCLITEAGELACVLGDPTDVPGSSPLGTGQQLGAARGTIKLVNANQITGSGRFYAAPGRVLWDGTSKVADFTITSDSLVDQRVLNLTFDSLGTVTTLSARFDHYYIHHDSLKEVAGVYASADLMGESAALVIEPNGRLLVQTASGCVGDGQLTVIEPEYNSYAMRLALTNCPGRNDAYEGLVTVIDFAWVNGVTIVLMAAFNNTGYVVVQAWK